MKAPNASLLQISTTPAYLLRLTILLDHISIIEVFAVGGAISIFMGAKR